jgi:alkyl hydroperoxide reductase subunit AhpC
MIVRSFLVTSCLIQLLMVMTVVGCSKKDSEVDGKSKNSGSAIAPKDFASNHQSTQPLGELRVWHPTEEMVTLSKYIGEKNLVLVVSRGFSGALCPMCIAQVQSLTNSYSQFTDRDAQVVVLFPVQDQDSRSRWENLRDSALDPDKGLKEIPFPILVDVEQDVVKRLGIEDELAKPSIFIVDKKGEVQYAYVGSDPADRPNVEVVLQRLDAIK